jgi:histidyl-tRNA synthetase
MHREPQPAKLYAIESIYRYAAPQRGRYREHWQLSVEALGSADPAIDAEIVQLYQELLRRLGLEQWELRLNSIGDRNCRPAYIERLNEWLDAHADVLDEEARQKRATTPLRVFDVKTPGVRQALEDAPKIGESLCEACRVHFDEVRRYLEAYDVPYRLEPTLVRGLDYYTRTTFEFVGPEEGAQSVICGGGRYDYLVEEIGGPATPAIGFGAGIERLVLALEQEGVTAEAAPLDVFIVTEEDKPVTLLAELRRRGLSVDVDYAGRSIKGQLTHARRLRARTVVVLEGERATIRRRAETDEAVPVGELVARLTR